MINKNIILFIVLVGVAFGSSLDDISPGINGFAKGNCGLTRAWEWDYALANPALLARDTIRGTISIENSRWLMDTSIYKLAVSYQLFGINMNAGIIRLNDDTGFEYTSATGTFNSMVQYSENLSYLGMGFRTLGIDSGITFKYFFKKALLEKNYYALDYALLLGDKKSLELALKLNNFMGSFEKNDNFFYYSAGVNWSINSLVLFMEYMDNYKKLRYGAGFELDNLTLSAGIDEDSGFSAGLGINLGSFVLDYAYKNINVLGVVNRFGISLIF